jgi:DNA recombination protein RmuC
MSFESLTLFGLAFLAGAILGWLLVTARSGALRSRASLLENDLAIARRELEAQREANAQVREAAAALKSTLAQEQKASTEKVDVLNRASQELRDAFKSLAADALRSNNTTFLELARTNLAKFQSEAKGDLEARQKAVENLVAPIKESLTKVDTQIQHMEQQRGSAYATLTEQVRSLIATQEQLRGETGNLVKALRAPSVRGRWGEIQLKRVVEIAGMLSYCDFSEQETIHTSDGRLRPDLIVKLPGGKNIVVDAKTPLEAYLNAIETTDDDIRRVQLREHAKQVRGHMEQLSAKAYWAQFESSPEFVVMFLPGETFFSAALEQDPRLIEEGINQQVIPASPTTLIALLKAVAFGWRQEKLARSAQQISVLGKELHDRLRVLASHLENVGKGLDRAVECYNKAVGTLESRVLVSARKFGDLGAPIAEEIGELEPIETTTRTLALDWGDEALDVPAQDSSHSQSDDSQEEASKNPRSNNASGTAAD